MAVAGLILWKKTQKLADCFDVSAGFGVAVVIGSLPGDCELVCVLFL